jgi:regulatory protein
MPPASREEWAKQARFLQSRGFGFEIIKKVINEQEDEV